jgi:hypothetical protein
LEKGEKNVSVTVCSNEGDQIGRILADWAIATLGIFLKITHRSRPGLQIFLGTVYQKRGKIYQMATTYIKWPKHIPDGHKIYQHLTLQGPPKLIQNWDFWFENMQSGNPEVDRIFVLLSPTVVVMY